MKRHTSRGLLALCLLALPALAAPAAAQDKVFRNLDAVAGKGLLIGRHANVSKECAAGPLPEVKVVTPPKNGQLAVRSGKTKAGGLKRCPSLEVPLQGLFYQAKARFAGADEVVYEVKQPDGKTQVIAVKITVSEQPKTGAKPSGDVEL